MPKLLFSEREVRLDAPDERVPFLNDFARDRHPGMCGVEVLSCEPELVSGRLDVTAPLVAGTGFLWAPVVITLAGCLCAAAMGENLPEDASFTTVELKANFIGTVRARAAPSSAAPRRPTAGAPPTSGTWKSPTSRTAGSSRCSAAPRWCCHGGAERSARAQCGGAAGELESSIDEPRRAPTSRSADP